MTPEREQLPPGLGVPELHRPVAAGRGQPVPVGAERHGADGRGVTLDRELLPPGRGVPEPQRAIAVSGGQATAVGCEGQADRTARAAEGGDLPSCGGIQDRVMAVRGRRHQPMPVPAEPDIAMAVAFLHDREFPRGQLPAGRQVPHLERERDSPPPTSRRWPSALNARHSTYAVRSPMVATSLPVATSQSFT